MKIYIKREDLKKLYYENKLSFSEIGQIYDCSNQTICNRFKDFNLKSRTTSESLNGRKHTWGDKISKSLRGRIISESSRRKVSKKTKGRPAWNKGLTKLNDKRMRNTGKVKENHWNWKGGISSKNILERQSSKYKQWRRRVFKRDNYTCQMCSVRGGKLNAHHIKGFAEDKLLRYNMRNGITLCVKCHKKVHRFMRLK